MKTFLVCILAGALPVMLAVCSCGGSPLLPADTASRPADPAGPPSLEQLEQLLAGELARLGIDGSRTASMAPGPGTSVFDLGAAIVEAAGDDPAGVALDWTFRSPGDYDLNGEVNISDLSSIVVYWGSQVAYDNPALHDGIDYWPSGQPDDVGEASPGEPPSTGSGAENWRAAQADGDSNGEVSISDITPIAVAFNTAIQRYNIYMREAGTDEFAKVGEAVFSKPEVPQLPLRLSYFYEYTPETADLDLEFMVRPENTILEAEGPDSNVALAGDDPYAGLPAVELAVDVSAGPVPLPVEFTATPELVPDTTVVSYEWDFDGNGDFELDTETVNTATHTYEVPGIYVARLRITDSDGKTALTGIVITAGEPPIANFEASPEGGEVPVTVELDGRFSYSALGEIVSYEWDLDGDGFFETDRRGLSDLDAVYTEAGTVDVGLRVTDDIGLTGERYITLEFTDDYEEVEPNSLALTATNLGELAQGAGLQTWRANVGAFGYDGDDVDWFSFSVTGGVDGSFSLEVPEDDVLINVKLIDTNTFSVLHELPGVTADVSFSHGIRGAGTYFLRIENLNTVTGLNYDYLLGLDLTQLQYDEVENNDTAGSANDLGTLVSNLLPSTWGSLGPDGYDGDDDDWFKFSIEDAGTVTVLLDFFHHEADLELAVYDETADVIYGVSESVSDKEQVEVELDPGTYAIRCYRRDGETANYELELALTQ